MRSKITASAEVQFRYGFSLYKCKRYVDAMEHLESAVAQQPHRYGWIQTLALNMQRMKRYDRALELFAAACNGDPEKITWRIRWAKCAKQARMQDLASQILDQLLIDFPESPEASAAIATFLKDNGLRWRELEVREAYKHLHADSPIWFRLAGEVAHFMAQFQRAVGYFNMSLELDPLQVETTYNLALSLDELGRQVDAQAAYVRAVELSEDPRVKEAGVGYLHERHSNWRKALTSYQADLATSTAHQAFVLHYRAGEASSRLFELREAAAHFQDAQRVSESIEEQVQAGYAAARALARLEDHEAVVAQYESFVHLVPEQSKVEAAVAYFRYGRSLHKTGDVQSATEFYLHAAQSWGYLSGSARASKAAGLRANEHRQIAALAESREDWAAAADHYGQALWHASSTERLWQARAGRALTQLGEFQRACRYFEGMLLFTEISVAGIGKTLNGVGRRRGALSVHARESEPLDDHLILFESSHGNSVHCHPYAIYRALREDPRFEGFRFAWVYNDQDELPAALVRDTDVAIIKQHSDKYIRLLGTAKYLINNATFPTYFLRRDGQQVLNTWHGTPLKFMGKLVKDGVAEHRNVQRNFMQTTHLMVPNRHTLKTLTVDHDLEGLFPGRVALSGSPRIDQMINMTPERRREILNVLGIEPDAGQKVVLFAPTWRGQLNDRSYDVRGLINDVARMSVGEHVTLFRAHRFAEKLIGDAQLDARIVPASIDTNELLAVVDVLITDYSSIFYDYLPTGKPIIFYTPDFEAYEAERGLYFEAKTWPGPVCHTIDATVREISRSLQSGTGSTHPNYAPAVDEFAALEDGQATGRVIDFFFFNDKTYVLETEADQRTKLLFYQGPFKPNGIATAFTNLISALDPQKYLVSVAVDMNAVGSSSESMDILNSLPDHVRILPRAGATIMSAEERWVSDNYHQQRGFSSAGAEDIHLNTMAREMRRSFGDVQFDVAIDFEGYSRFWAALFAAAHSHAKQTLIYLHNDMVGEWLLRFGTMPGLFATYPHFDKLVSVTGSVGELNQKQLSERFGIDPSLFVVSENLIDIEKPQEWAQLEEPAHVFAGEDVKVFVNMARLSPEKGQMKLLDAFEVVHQDHPQARLLLVGDGPLRSDLETAVVKRGLEGKVVITGQLANPFPTIKSADCFVFSSDYEGQGLAMVEALMLGLPAISTDVVGSRSVLEPGFGLLVENSTEGLAAGMVSYLNGYQAPRQFNAEEYQASALKQFENLINSSNELV